MTARHKDKMNVIWQSKHTYIIEHVCDFVKEHTRNILEFNGNKGMHILLTMSKSLVSNQKICCRFLSQYQILETLILDCLILNSYAKDFFSFFLNEIGSTSLIFCQLYCKWSKVHICICKFHWLCLQHYMTWMYYATQKVSGASLIQKTLTACTI